MDEVRTKSDRFPQRIPDVEIQVRRHVLDAKDQALGDIPLGVLLQAKRVDHGLDPAIPVVLEIPVMIFQSYLSSAE